MLFGRHRANEGSTRKGRDIPLVKRCDERRLRENTVQRIQFCRVGMGAGS